MIMDKKTWQILGVVVAGGCILEAMYYAIKWTSEKKRKGICEVLFFPDTNATCKEHYTNRHGCTAKYCSFSHEETVNNWFKRNLRSHCSWHGTAHVLHGTSYALHTECVMAQRFSGAVWQIKWLPRGIWFIIMPHQTCQSKLATGPNASDQGTCHSISTVLMSQLICFIHHMTVPCHAVRASVNSR